MTDADRERLTALAGSRHRLGYTEDAAALRRALAELDAVTAERDALQAIVVDAEKGEG